MNFYDEHCRGLPLPLHDVSIITVRRGGHDGPRGGRQSVESEGVVNVGYDRGGWYEGEGVGSWGRSGVSWTSVALPLFIDKGVRDVVRKPKRDV